MISGVIPVDKPEGFTSFDVVAKCRGILKERRIGHSGTLDPMATGVLPLFIGKAARAVDILPDTDKSYRAEFKLGFSTDTQDITGSVLLRSEKRAERSEIEAALAGFTGEISQIPPMYSAVKINGRRLYDLAREGRTVDRKPRKITVYRFILKDFDEENQSGVLEIDCSKGTYIRTLINDLGERLGTLGTMTALRRTRSQGFSVSQCVTLSQLESGAEKYIIPVERCFEAYPRLDLDSKRERLYLNGVTLGATLPDGLARVFGKEFIGIAKVSGGTLRPYKNFREAENE